MACSSPVEISRFVYSPLHGGRVKRYFLVPCGKCLDCLKARQQQYAFRAEWESLDPSNSMIVFATFTYSPEFLPDNNELSKDAVQHYVRRLRRRIEPVKCKYMFCGEYGEQYGRSHYHAILWFTDIVDYRAIVDSWPFGIVNISEFTTARGGYVAKYSVKQLGEDYSNHSQMPFLLISNTVGFYFLEMHGDYCRKNFIGSWENLSGYPVPLPRVFLDRLFPARDSVHRLKSFEGDAARTYYDSFAGDIRYFRLRRKCDYDARLKVDTALSGLSEPAFVGRRTLQNSFRYSNRISAIFERVSYETGRYY